MDIKQALNRGASKRNRLEAEVVDTQDTTPTAAIEVEEEEHEIELAEQPLPDKAKPPKARPEKPKPSGKAKPEKPKPIGKAKPEKLKTTAMPSGQAQPVEAEAVPAHPKVASPKKEKQDLNAEVEADGKRIYTTTDMRVGLFKPETA